jgi:hypothetical protein
MKRAKLSLVRKKERKKGRKGELTRTFLKATPSKPLKQVFELLFGL